MHDITIANGTIIFKKINRNFASSSYLLKGCIEARNILGACKVSVPSESSNSRHCYRYKSDSLAG